MYLKIFCKKVVWTAIVGSTTYDVVTAAGSFDDNISAIQTSPWWNNKSIAEIFASGIGNELGNFGGCCGPLFAYFPFSLDYVNTVTYVNTLIPKLIDFNIPTNLEYPRTNFSPYATATAVTPTPAGVPEPTGIVGTVLAVSAAVSYRRKLTLARTADDRSETSS